MKVASGSIWMGSTGLVYKKKDGDELFDHYRHMLESLGKDFSPSPLNSSPIEGEEFWRKTLLVEKGLLGQTYSIMLSYQTTFGRYHTEIVF